ncbi:hypothetical protein FHX77_001095 [Bifidobacterium commune]|uniref:hypothetical protein n=1 Tax=Bifidobacterium commune TaxID=1505727 RepID=UPI001356357B|nr:hypothetical protein [Bifidobacterium commune]MBB2955669.1 hypothetical protein [Bifidobacterium commune]
MPSKSGPVPLWMTRVQLLSTSHWMGFVSLPVIWLRAGSLDGLPQVCNPLGVQLD